MKYYVSLLLILSSISCSDLLSQQWLQKRILDKYRTQAQESISSAGSDSEYDSAEEYFSDEESMDTSTTKDSLDSYSDDVITDSDNDSESGDDIDDQLQREAFISRILRSHKGSLDITDYEQLALISNGLDKENLNNCIIKSLGKKAFDKKIFLENFYFKVFKYQSRHKINTQMKNIALADALKFPYLIYLNRKYKTELSSPFLEKVLNPRLAITQHELETIFIRTSHKIGNLNEEETLEQVFQNNLNLCESYKKSLDNITAIPKDCIIAQKDNVVQVKALQQVGASCAYYAIKNGILLADSLIRPNIKKTVLEAINKEGYFDRMFKDNSCYWKNLVLMRRLKSKLSDLIFDILLLSFQGARQISDTEAKTMPENLKLKQKTSDKWISLTPEIKSAESEVSIYRSSLVNFSKMLAKKILANITSFEACEGSYTLTRKDLLNKIRQEMRRQKRINKDNKIYASLSRKNKILQYFHSLQDITISISKNILSEDKSELMYDMKSSVKDVNPDQYLAGNWLNKEEIQFILNVYFPTHGVNPEVSLIILGDASLNQSLEEQISYETNILKTDILKQLRDPNKKYKILICFVNNHWISCVVHKIETGYEYYLANSLNNGNLVDSDLIRQIKNIIESDVNNFQNSNFEEKGEATTDISKTGKKSKTSFSIPKSNFSNIFGTIPQRAIDITTLWKNHRSAERIPYTMLLYGEPGTGKSLLAQAIAGELNAYFYHVIASNILKKHYGESEELVNNLFNDALEIANETNKPVVIFLDEIDAITDDSKESARKDILQAIHGILDSPLYKNKVLLIGATNTLTIAETFRSRNTNCMIHMVKPDKETKKELFTKFAQQFKLVLDDTTVTRLTKKIDELSQREIEAIFVLAEQKRLLSKIDTITIELVEQALEDHKKEKKDIENFTNKAQSKKEWEELKKDTKRGFASAAGPTALAAVSGVACFFLGNYFKDQKQN